MTNTTSPKKDDAPIVLPAAAVPSPDKKDEANKEPATNSDKK
jgi:hypothetical protein